MEQMPVCLVVRRFTVGGLERVVSLLANELNARGRRVRVVVLGTASPNAQITELHGGVEVHVLDGPWRGRLDRLGQLARGHVVHLHFADGRIHPSVRWTLRAHPRVVVTYHSVYTGVRNRFTNAVDRAVTRRSFGVIACSDAVGRFCVEEVGLPKSLVTVIRNAVAEPAPTAVRIAPAPGFHLIGLASVFPHKNYVGLIRGLAAVRRRGHDVRLRIIGDGTDTARTLVTAMDLGVSAAIEWYGAVWKPDIVTALLHASDVFVSASRNEGLPLSVLEGLQSGMPMALSDIAPHREVAGDCAFYFRPDDPEHLADQIEALLDDRVRRERALAARERARLFSVDEFVDRHLALYDSRDVLTRTATHQRGL